MSNLICSTLLFNVSQNLGIYEDLLSDESYMLKIVISWESY